MPSRRSPGVVLALAFCGCGGLSTALSSGDESSSTTTDTGSTETSTTGGEQPGLDALALPPGHEVNTGRVATAHACASCHTNADAATAMRDEDGRAIAPHDLWRGTMMANSGRDPFWHAMVEAEVLATPSAAAAIEAKCTRCHAPLLTAELQLTNAGPVDMAMLFEQGSDHAALGLDGVSCTLCHQIEDQGLGEDSSFTGGWVVAGEGRIYGPHAAPFEMPMLNHVSMRPVEGDHLLESAVCGTCHSLMTDALEPDGTPIGATLAEQTPYLEWRNSAYSTEATPGSAATSCQDCHVPTRSIDGEQISTRIARRPMGDDFPPISPRDEYGRHVFVGGNTTMLAVLRDQAETLRPDAPTAAFDATIAATREQLEQRTATLSLGQITRAGDDLHIDVTVDSFAGHKLPSGFPSRRVFVQVEVRNASEVVVFRSGGFDGRGRLVDSDGNVLAHESAGGPVMSHFDEITNPDHVQIWEAVMADANGSPVFRLLRGASFYKDNRLLPAGWDPLLATPEIAPVGVDGDVDFESAGDALTYVVHAPAAAGPYQIDVRVYYQALSPRFLAELFALDGPRIRAFEAMLELASLAPELLASASASG
jgi:hypothetical protein